jgi:rare lipoprotein A
MGNSLRVIGLLALTAAAPTAAAYDCLPDAPATEAGLFVAAPEMRRMPVRAASCITAAEVLALARRPTPALPPMAAPSPSRPANANSTANNGAYVPKTPHDNSPWRFDMQQNGKRMSAEEFDAWMKAKGIRVATGKPGGSTTPADGQAAPSNTSSTTTPAPSGDNRH